jgi:acyl-CoA reductase-like NAD-dependent aldehyde dehydrogenase
MNATVTDVDRDGRVRYAADGVTEGPAEWSQPTLQERRAIIYAAQAEMAALAELLDIFDGG